MQHGAVKHIETDTLSEVVGGRYALTTLVAKRLREVNSGAPLLVEQRWDERLIEAVCREIREGKIWLERPSEETARPEASAASEIDELFAME